MFLAQRGLFGKRKALSPFLGCAGIVEELMSMVTFVEGWHVDLTAHGVAVEIP